MADQDEGEGPDQSNGGKVEEDVKALQEAAMQPSATEPKPEEPKTTACTGPDDVSVDIDKLHKEFSRPPSETGDKAPSNGWAGSSSRRLPEPPMDVPSTEVSATQPEPRKSGGQERVRSLGGRRSMDVVRDAVDYNEAIGNGTAPQSQKTTPRRDRTPKRGGASDAIRRSLEVMRPSRGGYMDEEAAERGLGRRSIDVTRMRVSVEMRRNPGIQRMLSAGKAAKSMDATRRSVELYIGRTRSASTEERLADLSDDELMIYNEERQIVAEVQAIEGNPNNLGLLVELQERLDEVQQMKKRCIEIGTYRPAALSEFLIEDTEDLLNIKIAASTRDVQGVGLQRMMAYHKIQKWVEEVPRSEIKIFLELLPFAVIFLCIIIGASQSHFDSGEAIPGLLYSLTPSQPMVWPMASASHRVEAIFSLPGYNAQGKVPSSGGGGGHRRTHDMSGAPTVWQRRSAEGECRRRAGGGGDSTSDDACNELVGPTVRVVLVEMKDNDQAWLEHESDVNWQHIEALSVKKSEIANFTVGAKPQMNLELFDLGENPDRQFLIAYPDAPVGIGIKLHSLGVLGPHQVGLAGGIMAFVFILIMTEVLHRTMAAMIGATLVLITLACQNRVPTLGRVVEWMDHGTLGLLWGMMLIVGITMRTGVFEWTGVLACKLAGGSKVKLVLLLCTVTAVLSAFLDNVTTILLIAPVTCKLCKLVNVDPRPYLVAEAIFSNVGGTATMIGDPPNIIVGNMLKEHLDFTAFLINLAPAVLFTSPFIFFYIWFVYRKDFEGRLEADVPALQKMYPITNRGLLIKCMLVLGCVILCFFLHPVTHVDPAFVAILGAVWLLIAFDLHHCHEALVAVEWDTLLFFAALFVVVEGVGELGLLRAIANVLSDIVASVPIDQRQVVALILIVWASAIFSAFVDNIPFTATMVPVLQQLVNEVEGVSIRPLAWALCLGACFGGNGTLIGASANIVMASKAEVEGYPISFISFFKVGFPAMIMSVCIATAYLAAVNSIFAPWY